jgi:hypothetical protein
MGIGDRTQQHDGVEIDVRIEPGQRQAGGRGGGDASPFRRGIGK